MKHSTNLKALSVRVKKDGDLTISQKKNELLEILSVSSCLKHSEKKLRKISDVVKSKSDSLVSISREVGEEWTIAYVTTWVIFLNGFVNVNKKLNDTQIQYVSQRLFNLHSFTVADLTYFITSIVDGKYGPLYENLSVDKIMSWADEYWEQRLEAASMVAEKEHSQNKNPRNNEAPLLALSKDEIDALFDGVGEQELDHDKKGGGVGSVKKNKVENVFDKFKEGFEYKPETTNRQTYLNRMYQSILVMKDETLKKYYTNADAKSEEYDEEVFKMVEEELDKRNTNK